MKAQGKQASKTANHSLLLSDNSQAWKMLLVGLLAVITLLLGVVIYLIVDPKPDLPPLEKVLAQSRLDKQQDSIQRISFETTPLPAYVEPKPQKKVVQQVKEKSTGENQIVVSAESKTEQSLKQAEEDINYDSVSSDLQKRFEMALLMDEQEAPVDNEEQDNEIESSDIEQMPTQFQDMVPAMRYDSHMYSTVDSDRWIRINGEDLKEGEKLAGSDIQLVEILPQRSIFRLGRQSFSLESLTDWESY